MPNKITLETIWNRDNIKVSRRTAKRIAGCIPRCGYEILVATRIHNNYQEKLWLQNISNAEFRFWRYIDVVAVQSN